MIPVRRSSERESVVQFRSFIDAASEGTLIISPVAFAELAPSTRDEVGLTSFLKRLSIAYDPISPAAAHLSGLTFRNYRQAGVPGSTSFPIS